MYKQIKRKKKKKKHSLGFIKNIDIFRNEKDGVKRFCKCGVGVSFSLTSVIYIWWLCIFRPRHIWSKFKQVQRSTLENSLCLPHCVILCQTIPSTCRGAVALREEQQIHAFPNYSEDDWKVTGEKKKNLEKMFRTVCRCQMQMNAVDCMCKTHVEQTTCRLEYSEKLMKWVSGDFKTRTKLGVNTNLRLYWIIGRTTGKNVQPHRPLFLQHWICAF